MGDFAGGMLKYLRTHRLPRVTIAGGFAKMTKLAQGFLDLHSRSGAVDKTWLADRLAGLGATADIVTAAGRANTAAEVQELAEGAGLPLAAIVAERARLVAAKVLDGTDIVLDVLVFDREGRLLASAPPAGSADVGAGDGKASP
jgi:cobalt-precorrin-5B (C1)-methyltransferase